MSSANASGGPDNANISTANPVMPYTISRNGTARHDERNCKRNRPIRYTVATNATTMNCGPVKRQSVSQSPE